MDCLDCTVLIPEEKFQLENATYCTHEYPFKAESKTPKGCCVPKKFSWVVSLEAFSAFKGQLAAL